MMEIIQLWCQNLFSLTVISFYYKFRIRVDTTCIHIKVNGQNHCSARIIPFQENNQYIFKDTYGYRKVMLFLWYLNTYRNLQQQHVFTLVMQEHHSRFYSYMYLFYKFASKFMSKAQGSPKQLDLLTLPSELHSPHNVLCYT